MLSFYLNEFLYVIRPTKECNDPREKKQRAHMQKSIVYYITNDDTLNFNYKGPLYMNIDGQGD